MPDKLIYIFHREEGWYPLELENDQEAITNALCNPGTLKVSQGARIVWRIQ